MCVNKNGSFYFKLNSFFIICLLLSSACLQAQQKPVHYKWKQFCMGVDLSFVNEIDDYGGVYKDNGKKGDAFKILHKYGANTVRVRLWHQPDWIAKVTGGKLYSDIADVEKTMRRAKALGMAVNLDLHYGDDWVDPNQQPTPDAWKNLSLDILADTVYNYTLNVLKYFKQKNLVPEMIQVGNETNFGMLWPVGKIDSAGNGWDKFGILLNKGIKAVRDFSKTSAIKPKIILHVAQLQFAEQWIKDITTKASVTDFDILGLSHYYKWSTVDSLKDVGRIIATIRKHYKQQVMIVETAFPFTMQSADSYGNLFGGDIKTISGFEVSKEGQLKYFVELTQQVINAGGSGIMYWEPAWITSPMKDRWGQGSSWENACLFDFEGNTLPAIKFMQHPYIFKKKK